MAKLLVDTRYLSRAEWLQYRNLGLGGSDAGIILGVNKWKTPFELFLEKSGQIDIKENDNGNEAMYWGNVLEEVVAKEFTARTGKKVRRKNQMLQHDNYPFMMANIDREVVGEKAILECKTTSAYNAKEWEGDEVPASYLIQINHYMAVMGYEKCYIACLIGGNKFVFKEIKRDEELINLIIEAEKNFWEFHVQGNHPPALDGSSAAEKYIKERYEKAEKGKVVDLKSEHKGNIESYLQLKEQKALVETDLKRIENLIKNDLEDAESGMVNRFIVNWKNVNSNRVDSKLLKEKYPDIYEQVCKVSSSRRFEIKEAKE
jgi:putative phage-type endonuclease